MQYAFMLSLPLILIKHHRIFRLSAAVFSGWSCVKILRYLMRTDFHVAAEYNALFYKCLNQLWVAILLPIVPIHIRKFWWGFES